MSETIDLNEIERKAFGSYFQPWLYDIGFGVLILSLALAPLIRGFIGYGYILFLIAPAPLIMFFATNKILKPRLGLVKFSKRRQLERNNMMIVNAIGVAGLMMLVILTYFGVFPWLSVTELIGGLGLMTAIGIAVILGVGFFAYVTDFPRIALYGLIIGLGIPFAEFFDAFVGNELANLLVWGIPAVFLVVLGLVELKQFLKNYPLEGEQK